MTSEKAFFAGFLHPSLFSVSPLAQIVGYLNDLDAHAFGLVDHSTQSLVWPRVVMREYYRLSVKDWLRIDARHGPIIRRIRLKRLTGLSQIPESIRNKIKEVQFGSLGGRVAPEWIPNELEVFDSKEDNPDGYDIYLRGPELPVLPPTLQRFYFGFRMTQVTPADRSQNDTNENDNAPAAQPTSNPFSFGGACTFSLTPTASTAPLIDPFTAFAWPPSTTAQVITPPVAAASNPFIFAPVSSSLSTSSNPFIVSPVSTTTTSTPDFSLSSVINPFLPQTATATGPNDSSSHGSGGGVGASTAALVTAFGTTLSLGGSAIIPSAATETATPPVHTQSEHKKEENEAEGDKESKPLDELNRRLKFQGNKNHESATEMIKRVLSQTTQLTDVSISVEEGEVIGALPSTVERLSIYMYHSELGDSWPASLKHLKVEVDNESEVEFDRIIPPIGLESLEMPGTWGYYYYGETMEMVTKMDGLVNIAFGTGIGSYRHDLFAALPRTVKYVRFNDCMCLEGSLTTDVNSLPDSVEKLSWVFNNTEVKRWPSQLREVKIMGNAFAQDISNLPNTVKLLYLPTSYTRPVAKWPNILTELELGPQFMDITSAERLPATIRRLTISLPLARQLMKSGALPKNLTHLTLLGRPSRDRPFDIRTLPRNICYLMFDTKDADVPTLIGQDEHPSTDMYIGHRIVTQSDLTEDEIEGNHAILNDSTLTEEMCDPEETVPFIPKPEDSYERQNREPEPGEIESNTLFYTEPDFRLIFDQLKKVHELRFEPGSREAILSFIHRLSTATVTQPIHGLKMKQLCNQPRASPLVLSAVRDAFLRGAIVGSFEMNDCTPKLAHAAAHQSVTCITGPLLSSSGGFVTPAATSAPPTATKGTRHRPFFLPPLEHSYTKDSTTGRIIATQSGFYQSITCSSEFQSKSFEELRCEDEAVDSPGDIQTDHLPRPPATNVPTDDQQRMASFDQTTAASTTTAATAACTTLGAPNDSSSLIDASTDVMVQLLAALPHSQLTRIKMHMPRNLFDLTDDQMKNLKNGETIIPIGLSAFCRSITRMPHLRTLVFRGCYNLGDVPGHMELLVRSILQSSTIENVDLGGNIFFKLGLGLSSVVDLIKQTKKLKRLVLSNAEINLTGINQICKAVIENKSLVSLNLAGNRTSLAGLNVIRHALRHNPRIEITVCHLDFGIIGLGQLRQKRHRRLKESNLIYHEHGISGREVELS